MIVIEGMDGTGKSTLAIKLGEAFGLEVVHTGGPTKDHRDVKACLARSLRRLKAPVVQDRITHVSEVVYSMLTNPHKAALATGAVSELAAARVIIYCRPPDAVVFANLEAHVDKEHDTPEHMEGVRTRWKELLSIYDWYFETLRLLGATVITYDYTTDDVDAFVRNLAFTVKLELRRKSA